MPRALCRPVSPDPCPKTRRRLRRPTRRALPPHRTRKCPMTQGKWAEKVSRWLFVCQIEPGRRLKFRQQSLALARATARVAARGPHHKIAVLVDCATLLALARKPLEIRPHRG